MLVIRTVQYQVFCREHEQNTASTTNQNHVFCREHEQNTASTANQNHVFFIFNMLEATDE